MNPHSNFIILNKKIQEHYAILALFMSSQCLACEQSTDMLNNECMFDTKWLSSEMSVNFSTLGFFFFFFSSAFTSHNCILSVPFWVEKSAGIVLNKKCIKLLVGHVNSPTFDFSQGYCTGLDFLFQKVCQTVCVWKSSFYFFCQSFFQFDIPII